MSGEVSWSERRDDPSLVLATQLVSTNEGCWVLGLWPDALEASGSFHGTAPVAPRIYVPKGEGRNPERSRSEASRRAASRLRRYSVANRLNRFGSLTYAHAQEDGGAVREDIGDFFRRLRSSVGKDFAYAWVTEWHPGGHGIHVHFAVGRYVKVAVIREAWGRVIVDIRRRSDLRMGGGEEEEARHAARYMAKYLRKGFEDEGLLGQHRFDVAQGFRPRLERLEGRSMADVTAKASDRIGYQPSYIWRSRDAKEWFGPSALWLSWNG